MAEGKYKDGGSGATAGNHKTSMNDYFAKVSQIEGCKPEMSKYIDKANVKDSKGSKLNEVKSK